MERGERAQIEQVSQSASEREMNKGGTLHHHRRAVSPCGHINETHKNTSISHLCR
jgi:hypothetical protein